LLKNKLGYKGLIITDALNMGAVAKKYKAGELDALAFKAGNDIMLFSQDVATGKKLIQQALDNGEIAPSRVEESVKKILLTKYYLGLTNFQPQIAENINQDLNNESHKAIVQKVYSHAITALKNDKQILPIGCKETVYYLPLEEAPYEMFYQKLLLGANVILKKADEISAIPAHSKIIIGLHKDNSTAYKPYKISEPTKNIIKNLSQNHQVILNVFGSPYALKDIDIKNITSVIVSYENNDDSMTATANALLGKTKIWGKLPVLVNENLTYGMGIVIDEIKK
jgi:beta-N-acetylhexosaminidase